jgi:hypothetical protein
MSRGELVLLNDTSQVDDNPGCQLTVAELVSGTEAALGRTFSQRVPWGRDFADFEPPAWFRRLGRLPCSVADFLRWAWWRSASLRSARRRFPTLDARATVIVNAEGSIHGDAAIARCLLGQAWALAHRGCRVEVVNGTFSRLSPRLLRSALFSAARVVAREPVSTRYLREAGIHGVVQGADCVFLCRTGRSGLDEARSASPRRCLVTPGTTLLHPTAESAPTLRQVGEAIAALAGERMESDLLAVEGEERAVLQTLGRPVLMLERARARDIFEVLTAYDLIVTGRYHVFLFAMLAGRPALLLESNSWKLRGACELLGVPGDRILRWSESSRLAHGGWREHLMQPPADSELARLRSLAGMNLPSPSGR